MQGQVRGWTSRIGYVCRCVSPAGVLRMLCGVGFLRCRAVWGDSLSHRCFSRARRSASRAAYQYHQYTISRAAYTNSPELAPTRPTMGTQHPRMHACRSQALSTPPSAHHASNLRCLQGEGLVCQSPLLIFQHLHSWLRHGMACMTWPAQHGLHDMAPVAGLCTTPCAPPPRSPSAPGAPLAPPAHDHQAHHPAHTVLCTAWMYASPLHVPYIPVHGTSLVATCKDSTSLAADFAANVANCAQY